MDVATVYVGGISLHDRFYLSLYSRGLLPKCVLRHAGFFRSRADGFAGMAGYQSAYGRYCRNVRLDPVRSADTGIRHIDAD